MKGGQTEVASILLQTQTLKNKLKETQTQTQNVDRA
jgi:hypothetical protein